jgi:hypothetical protein
MSLLLSMLLACAGPSGDLDGVSFTVNPRVSTVINAAWTSAEGGEARLEWGYDDRLTERTPSESVEAGEHSMRLIGPAAGARVFVRAVVETDDGDRLSSAVHVLDLPLAPGGDGVCVRRRRAVPARRLADDDRDGAAVGGAAERRRRADLVLWPPRAIDHHRGPADPRRRGAARARDRAAGPQEGGGGGPRLMGRRGGRRHGDPRRPPRLPRAARRPRRLGPARAARADRRRRAHDRDGRQAPPERVG